jgi:hypothetical protein
MKCNRPCASHVLFIIMCSLLESLDGCMCDGVTNAIPCSPNEDFGNTKFALLKGVEYSIWATNSQSKIRISSFVPPGSTRMDRVKGACVRSVSPCEHLLVCMSKSQDDLMTI